MPPLQNKDTVADDVVDNIAVSSCQSPKDEVPQPNVNTDLSIQLSKGDGDMDSRVSAVTNEPCKDSSLEDVAKANKSDKQLDKGEKELPSSKSVIPSKEMYLQKVLEMYPGTNILSLSSAITFSEDWERDRAIAAEKSFTGKI